MSAEKQSSNRPWAHERSGARSGREQQRRQDLVAFVSECFFRPWANGKQIAHQDGAPGRIGFVSWAQNLVFTRSPSPALDNFSGFAKGRAWCHNGRVAATARRLPSRMSGGSIVSRVAQAPPSSKFCRRHGHRPRTAPRFHRNAAPSG